MVHCTQSTLGMDYYHLRSEFAKSRIAAVFLLLIIALNIAIFLPLPVCARGIACLLLCSRHRVSVHRRIGAASALALAGTGPRRCGSGLQRVHPVRLRSSICRTDSGCGRRSPLSTCSPCCCSFCRCASRQLCSPKQKNVAPQAAFLAVAQAAALVIVAGILRLPRLDYAEFQDDEVSVIWHSAEAIRGEATHSSSTTRGGKFCSQRHLLIR